MSDNIQTPEQADEPGLIAYMFTNNKEQGPVLQQILDLFYRGVHDNTIGLMSAYNKKTGEEELVLVGVLHDGMITNTFPLARVFVGTEGAETYLGPDGKGGWLGEEDAPEQLELDFGEAANG